MYEHLNRPQLDALREEINTRIWNTREFLAGLEAEKERINEAIRSLGHVSVDAVDATVLPVPRAALDVVIADTPQGASGQLLV
jgi:hypothetical protein